MIGKTKGKYFDVTEFAKAVDRMTDKDLQVQIKALSHTGKEATQELKAKQRLSAQRGRDYLGPRDHDAVFLNSITRHSLTRKGGRWGFKYGIYADRKLKSADIKRRTGLTLNTIAKYMTAGKRIPLTPMRRREMIRRAAAYKAGRSKQRIMFPSKHTKALVYNKHEWRGLRDARMAYWGKYMLKQIMKQNLKYWTGFQTVRGIFRGR